MDAKKPPKLWRRWGRNEAGKEPFACPHSAESARETQAPSCRDCSFFRAVPLPSGRLRTLCMFHGTKNPVEPCHGFQPGRWEEVWGDPADRPRQSFVCRACAHGVVPHIRAALLGLVGCMAGRVPDGSAFPVHCRDFRAKGVRNAA